jgi:ADP-ribosyl-[dinitrogen reductase] hydrolase
MGGRLTRTSETHPIRADFLSPEVLGLSGRLGMTFAPGMKAYAANGHWERDLGADLRRLREHYRADVLVTLLEPRELDEFGIPDLVERAREVGLEVIHFPIVDVDTPHESEADEYMALVERIVAGLREGKTAVVHCRGGLGRTGTVAASVLVALGRAADEAIGLVRRTRSERSVETPEQEEYVRRFEKEWRRKATRPRRRGRGTEPTQIERYRGCLLGLATGDALGTTVEFKPPGSFAPLEDVVGGGPFGLRAGEWTDDTSMALCLAESLIEMRGFDPADQLRKYLRWYREGHMSATGECFDIGGATRRALERFKKTGEGYSGSRDPSKAGNGSIMRLAPVPLFYARGPLGISEDAAPSEAVERCGESSMTTHGAANCVDACRYLGALIIGAVNGASKEDLLSEHYCPVGGYWSSGPLTDEVAEVAAGSFKRKEPPEIRGRGYVVASLEAALWAFYNSHTFEEGALLAVNLGEDADTTGAVYGQLAGAYYGERGIPEDWKRKLAHRLLIEHFAERLFHEGKTVDWGRLLAFLPTLERSPYQRGLEVGEFAQVLYHSDVLFVFDWMQWRDTERLINEPAALADADEATLRRLLTFHARNEYFVEDHLVEMFENGHMAALLRRARSLVRQRT